MKDTKITFTLTVNRNLAASTPIAVAEYVKGVLVELKETLIERGTLMLLASTAEYDEEQVTVIKRKVTI